MIVCLDTLLHQFLIEQITELSDEAQVRFKPPNADWRTFITHSDTGEMSHHNLTVPPFYTLARTKCAGTGFTKQTSSKGVDLIFIIKAPPDQYTADVRLTAEASEVYTYPASKKGILEKQPGQFAV